MYLVVWTNDAFEQMATIIRGNRARKEELASALQELSLGLQLDANTAGESRGGTLRVILVGPLTVYYRVDGESNAAEIIRVRARFTA